MFSIHRNGKKPETEHPYPFNEKAIEQLVYKAASRVTPDLPNPSTFEFSWINNMIGLIRGKLGGFMSERNLTVYLTANSENQTANILTQQNASDSPTVREEGTANSSPLRDVPMRGISRKFAGRGEYRRHR
jgi:hypothetical protein